MLPCPSLVTRRRDHLVYLKLFWKPEKRKLRKLQRNKRGSWRDLEEENGGAGVYSASLRKHYILADDEWKEDIMPEILDGHNVYDFIDPDILMRLEELDQEEGIQQGLEADDDFEMDGDELSPEEQLALAEIRKKKSLLIQQHRIKKSTAESLPTVPRKFDKDKQFTTERMGRQLSYLGLDPTKVINRARSKSRGRKRERSLDRDDNDRGVSMDVDDDQPNKKMLVKERRIESFLLSSQNTCSLASDRLGKHRDGSDRKVTYRSLWSSPPCAERRLRCFTQLRFCDEFI